MKKLLGNPSSFIYCILVTLILSATSGLNAREYAVQTDITDFSTSKIYMYDNENEQWNLLRDISYHFTDTGRIDSVEVFSPFYPGVRLEDEVHIYSYDQLGRTDSVLILKDGRNQTLYEYSYYNDTELLTESKISVFPALVTPFLVDHIKWSYDDEGKLILYEEVRMTGNNKGDSIIYEYDNQGRESLITHYRYEPLSAKRVPWYLSTFNYNGDTLEQIDISFWNLGAQEWVANQRIIDIQDPVIESEAASPNLKGIAIEQEESLSVLKRKSFIRQVLLKAQFITQKKVLKSLKADGSLHVLNEILDVIPQLREERTTLMLNPIIRAAILEELSNIHRAELFFGDAIAISELPPSQQFLYRYYKKLSKDGPGDFIADIATQILVGDVEGFFESNATVKSAAVQRILTLTSQVAIGESGEWQNRFKQEFFYEGNATHVNNNPINDRISVFPNPSNGLLNVQFYDISGEVHIQIYNSVGQVVANERIEALSPDFKFEIETSALNKGIYFIKVYTGGEQYIEKIILQ